MENIRLSFQGIWSHKMRSFLTMLGIIIGIAAIISIVSTINGTNEQIQNNLIGSGDNIVNVSLYQADWEYDMTWEGIPDGFYPISDDTLEDINAVDNVLGVSLYTKRQDYGSTYYGNTSLDGVEIYGIDENYFNTASYNFTAGRPFSAEDYTNYRTVIVINDTVAKSVFQNESAIGKTLEISGTPFTIIGVVEERVVFEPVINTIDDYYTYKGSNTSMIFMPSEVWPMVYAYDEPENLIVKTTETEAMADAGRSTEEILNAHLEDGAEIQYRAEDILQQAQELQELSNATNQQLIWIASISLLVGGIGVMNIMLVSVTERTREIGLKKAIGARKSRILWQFLTEAAVLTSLGGIIGIIAGVIMANVISNLTSTPVLISAGSVVISVAFSMVIGLLFGLLPSIKAANLNPIDALRHE